MKKWVKNGLIGIGVFVLLLLGYYIINRNTDSPIASFLGSIISFPGDYFPGPQTPINVAIFIIIEILFWFLLGALIGWIIGKLKKKS